MKRIIFEKYFETFNFYFAKPINEILANVVVSHVIFFKDMIFMLDENEYLKRFYRFDEVQPRMAILTEFYEEQYTQVFP